VVVLLIYGTCHAGGVPARRDPIDASVSIDTLAAGLPRRALLLLLGAISRGCVEFSITP